MILDAYPDQAAYTPGQPVQLTVELEAGQPVNVQSEVTISYLWEKVVHLTQSITLKEECSTPVHFNWQPPTFAPRGYGVDIVIYSDSGDILDQSSTAFDVLVNWTQAPRYGFLTDFTPNRRDIEAIIETLCRYHINGLQFYDWMYRHDTLLPPDPTGNFIDPLGRELSMQTIRAFIQAAHRRSIAAMPYTAIYAASPSFAELRPGWRLYDLEQKAMTFADDFLALMNPAVSSNWAAHLLNEFDLVLKQTDFDGIHIDQYGEEHVGATAYTIDNQPVDIKQAFAGLITEAKDHITQAAPERNTVIFNCVGNWPVEAITPGPADFTYIEVWPPDDTYQDLHRIIANARQLEDKPVVLAAYTSPQWEINVRLMKAVIFASGGSQIELGEHHAMLSDPYFPKHAPIPSALRSVLRRSYDFSVRYENILKAVSAQAITIDGISTSLDFEVGKVAVVSYRLPGLLALSLVNLTGLSSPRWTECLTGPPAPIENLTLSLPQEENILSIWSASPDDNPALIPVDANGSQFTLNKLEFWTLILIKTG